MVSDPIHDSGSGVVWDMGGKRPTLPDESGDREDLTHETLTLSLLWDKRRLGF